MLRSITLFSGDLPGGSFTIDYRFAPSICRSMGTDSGEDVISGLAEHEVGMAIEAMARKMMDARISISNAKVYWDSMENQEGSNSAASRKNYNAVYLEKRELEAYERSPVGRMGIFRSSCRIDSRSEHGGYLICRGLKRDKWDELMVDVAIRSIPLEISRK